MCANKNSVYLKSPEIIGAFTANHVLDISGLWRSGTVADLAIVWRTSP